MERYSMDYGCAFRDEQGDWVEALSAIERIEELEQRVMALKTENAALVGALRELIDEYQVPARLRRSNR